MEYFHANLEEFGIEERHMNKEKELLENYGSWHAYLRSFGNKGINYKTSTKLHF